MRIAYFDCFAGISGDMTLAAFIDAGLDVDFLKRELSKLKIRGYKLLAKKTFKNSVHSTMVDVIVDKHKEAHRGRASAKEIFALIDKSSLNKEVKDTAKEIFSVLIEGESKIHNTAKDKLHLHEIGDVDSIVDIVGASIAVKALGIEKVYCSTINLSRGFIDARHGILPSPSPITLSVLKNVPVNIVDFGGENVTPTGAAIIKVLAESFGRPPLFSVKKIGYGAGHKNFKDVPNMLRIAIGDSDSPAKIDKVVVLETEIDDMNPVGCGHLIDRLLESGALDAFLVPIYMKKSRPGILLTVLTEEKFLNKVSNVVFDETTTLGVRFYRAERLKLDRKIVRVKTKYGKARVKIAIKDGKILRMSPEYEDCLKISKEKKIPLLKVYDYIKAACSGGLN